MNPPTINDTLTTWTVASTNLIPISRHEKNVYNFVNKKVEEVVTSIVTFIQIANMIPRLDEAFREFCETIDSVTFLEWLDSENEPFEIVIQVPPVKYTFRASNRSKEEMVYVLGIDIALEVKKPRR